MEIEMDKLVQEKEATKAQEVLATVIPMVTTTILTTLLEELSPNVPLATIVLVTSSTTSATKSLAAATQQSYDASKMVKEM